MSKSDQLFQRDKASISQVMKLRFYPFVAEKSRGVILEDPDGKEYLDFSAGWGVANIGYNHPRIETAVCKQMKKLPFTTTTSVLNRESIQLAERLKSLIPGTFEKSVWYGHSGSDANEFIAKIAPLATGKNRILTFVGSYHGQTMGAYAMFGHPAQGRMTGGGNITKVPYPYCYRCAFEKTPDRCDLFCLRYLEDYVFGAVTSPEQIGTMIIEAVQCDGGDIVPPKGFLKGLEQLCKKHHILLILDEVKIGFGRTGSFFGFQQEDVIPDAVIVAKPMASGLPLSAVVGRNQLMNAGTGMHLFTTAGNPLACRVSMETIDIIKEERLEARARDVGSYLFSQCKQMQKDYPCIGDVRGRGLVMGLELVKDKATKGPASEMAALLVYRAFELGLILYDSGIHSNVLELTPPLIITKEYVDRAIFILRSALDDVLDGKVTKECLRDFAGWCS